MPVVVVPQILLCGLFVARSRMNGFLEALSNLLPLTFSVDALQEIAGNSAATAAMWQDVGIMASVVLAVLVLAAMTLRRSTP